MKKSVMIALILVFLIAFNGVNAMVAVRTKECANSLNRYSWLGIWVYQLKLQGWYDSDGLNIVRYGATACNTRTFGWSATNKSSMWISKFAKSGWCRAKATFVLGIASSMITVGIQTMDEEIRAYAKP